jgi:hypothetical protein
VVRGLVAMPQEAVRSKVPIRLGRGARRISLGYMAIGRLPG